MTSPASTGQRSVIAVELPRASGNREAASETTRGPRARDPRNSRRTIRTGTERFIGHFPLGDDHRRQDSTRIRPPQGQGSGFLVLRVSRLGDSADPKEEENQTRPGPRRGSSRSEGCRRRCRGEASAPGARAPPSPGRCPNPESCRRCGRPLGLGSGGSPSRVRWLRAINMESRARGGTGSSRCRRERSFP